jgi:Tfp pilus assembly PilM family ATPase
MLNPGSSTIGIEITDCSIKIVEITVTTKKRPYLNKFMMERLPRQTIDDGKMKDAALVAETIRDMLGKMNIRRRNVHFIVPSQLVMVRFLKLPDIPDKDLRKVVEFEMKHSIHLPFEQPYYDFCKLTDSDHPGTNKKARSPKKQSKAEREKDSIYNEAAAGRQGSGSDGIGLFEEFVSQQTEDMLQCDVMLVAAPKETVDEYISVMESAGLRPSGIEIKALSLFRIIEFFPIIDERETFLLVDINDAATDLSIFHDKQLKITRSVPLDFSAADPSDDMDNDDTFNQSCQHLTHELERLMNFYRYTLNNRNQEFKRVVISGDVSRLDAIIDSLRNRLPLRITPLHADMMGVHHSGSQDCFTNFAVPIGLALRGITP